MLKITNKLIFSTHGAIWATQIKDNKIKRPIKFLVILVTAFLITGTVYADCSGCCSGHGGVEPAKIALPSAVMELRSLKNV